MMDGAMMNIAPIKNSESLRSNKKTQMPLSSSRDNSKSRQENLMSNRDDNKFEKDLNRSMDKGDRNNTQAPKKFADNSPKESPKVEAKQSPTRDEKTSVSANANSPHKAQSSEDRSLKPMMLEDKGPSREAMELSAGLETLSLAKQQDPVLQFMDSMESEFGIEPDRLISAFGHLSDAQLMQSPEKSMDAYLSQLNLADGEMPRAEELYSKLLVDMRMQKIGKQDNTNLIPVELQSAMSEMQTLQKPVALDKAGIEGMNEKFFNVYPNHFGRPLQASNPEQGNLAQAGFMPNAEGQFVPDATQAMNPDEAALSQDSQNPVDTADALWAQRIGQKAAEKEESGNLLGLATAGAAGAGAISEMDAPDAEVPEWLSKLNEVNVEPEAEAKITAKADDSSNFDDGNSQGSSEGNSSLLNPEGTATKSGADKFAKVLATGTAANSASSQSESEGVESIVKNVQLLKNRGGGEMKVQLNQEGLGDVQLKVAVNEGKVNIQMLTENKDAKKLLESDLGALKVELGDKKIDLSEIKVDVAKDLKNSLEQQLQDQRREETRQFWQQFKEENDAKRAMAVNMGLNSYTKKDPDSINDRTEQAARYRSSNLDTRLNIVA